MSDWPAAASARLTVAARGIASAALDGVVTMSHLPCVLSLRSPHGGNSLCRTVTRKVKARVLALVEERGGFRHGGIERQGDPVPDLVGHPVDGNGDVEGQPDGHVRRGERDR